MAASCFFFMPKGGFKLTDTERAIKIVDHAIVTSFDSTLWPTMYTKYEILLCLPKQFECAHTDKIKFILFRGQPECD